MVTLPLLYIKKSFLLSLGGAAANSEVSNHSQSSLSVGDIIDFGSIRFTAWFYGNLYS